MQRAACAFANPIAIYPIHVMRCGSQYTTHAWSRTVWESEVPKRGRGSCAAMNHARVQSDVGGLLAAPDLGSGDVRVRMYKCTLSSGIKPVCSQHDKKKARRTRYSNLNTGLLGCAPTPSQYRIRSSFHSSRFRRTGFT